MESIFYGFKTLNFNSMEEILNKIGQLQYEISCLGLDKETLTGVTIRTEELKELVKNCSIPDVVGRSEQLPCTCATYCDKHMGQLQPHQKCKGLK